MAGARRALTSRRTAAQQAAGHEEEWTTRQKNDDGGREKSEIQSWRTMKWTQQGGEEGASQRSRSEAESATWHPDTQAAAAAEKMRPNNERGTRPQRSSSACTLECMQPATHSRLAAALT